MKTDMRYFMHLTAGMTQPSGGGPEVSTHHAEAVETVAGYIYRIYRVSTQYLQYLHSRYLGWDGRCGRRHASAQTDAENWLAPVEVMGGAAHSSAQFSPAPTLLQRNNHSDDFIQLGGSSQQTATMKTFQTVSNNCNIKALNLVCFK